MRRAFLLCLALGGLALQLRAAPPQPEPTEEDVLGENAGCYVCHTTFVKEELAAVHLKAKIGCTKCHGPSAKHANDENIGASKPDITYRRDQVDASCAKCHSTHDAPAKQVLARFQERKLPHAPEPVCTDCHGTHKVERSSEKR